MVISALERAMPRAWGLHRQAHFKDLGDNRFVVRFSSEGDWRHVLKNGPWQFDFHVILLKDYDGSIRPSDMVFDSMEVWVRVLDLPMDMMNAAYGKLIGGWIGKYISVEVDEDGLAWGTYLRIRVEIQVTQPLLRVVTLKDREEEEGDEEEDDEAKKKKRRWFDLKYEKIPHFCFDCGCLVHKEEGYLAEKEEVQQWGEWLRASPRRNKKPPPAVRPSVSSGSYSYSGRSASSGVQGRMEATVRDIPPRRNLSREFTYSGSSRTGGNEHRREEAEYTSPRKNDRSKGKEQEVAGSRDVPRTRNRTGTYARRPRKNSDADMVDRSKAPMGAKSKK
jgi:hypothetical protein